MEVLFRVETKSENVMFAVAAAAEEEAEEVEAGVVFPIIATAKGRPNFFVGVCNVRETNRTY